MLWNSPLFRDGLGNGALALLAVLVFKGLPPLLLTMMLVRAAHDREADYYAGQLAKLDDRELITPDELSALKSGARRATARWHARTTRVRRQRRAPTVPRRQDGRRSDRSSSVAARGGDHRAPLASVASR